MSKTALSDLDTTPHLAAMAVILAEERGSRLMAQQEVRDLTEGVIPNLEEDRDMWKARAEELAGSSLEGACRRIAKGEIVSINTALDDFPGRGFLLQEIKPKVSVKVVGLPLVDRAFASVQKRAGAAKKKRKARR